MDVPMPSWHNNYVWLLLSKHIRQHCFRRYLRASRIAVSCSSAGHIIRPALLQLTAILLGITQASLWEAWIWQLLVLERPFQEQHSWALVSVLKIKWIPTYLALVQLAWRASLLSLPLPTHQRMYVPECSGQVSSFFERTCLNPFAAERSAVNCFRTDGEIGGRCLSADTPAVINADFFTEAKTTCFAASTTEACPSGCQEALQKIKDQLGCCYQNYFNSSLALDSMFYVLDTITANQRDFFTSLGSQELWESCEVSLQPRCTGDPYAAAGALQLAASTITVMMCLVGVNSVF